MWEKGLRGVRLLARGGDDRPRHRAQGATERLVVEGGEIAHRATAAGDDDGVDERVEARWAKPATTACGASAPWTVQQALMAAAQGVTAASSNSPPVAS